MIDSVQAHTDNGNISMKFGSGEVVQHFYILEEAARDLILELQSALEGFGDSNG